LPIDSLSILPLSTLLAYPILISAGEYPALGLAEGDADSDLLSDIDALADIDVLGLILTEGETDSLLLGLCDGEPEGDAD